MLEAGESEEHSNRNRKCVSKTESVGELSPRTGSQALAVLRVLSPLRRLPFSLRQKTGELGGADEVLLAGGV